MILNRTKAALVGAVVLALSAPAGAQDFDRRTEDEKMQARVDRDVLTARRELFRARRMGNEEEAKRLEMEFQKAQERRFKVLRDTHQM